MSIHLFPVMHLYALQQFICNLSQRAYHVLLVLQLRSYLHMMQRSCEGTLGKFSKLGKATISFVNSVCPSVRPH